MIDLIYRKLEWSRRTFPRQNVRGIIDHLRLELDEVHLAPYDLSERADVALLLMDLWDRGWAQPLEAVMPSPPSWRRPPSFTDFCGFILREDGWRPVASALDDSAIPGVTHPLNLGFAIARCFADLMLADHEIRMVIETKLAENMQRTWIIGKPHEAVRHV